MLNLFDKIAYINLKIRPDRKSFILKELKRLNVDTKKIQRIEATYAPVNGHLGCVISHIEALDFAIKNNLQNILILEDDCTFIEDVNFLNFSIEYFFKIVKKWDVFLLGGYYEEKKASEYPFINKITNSYRAHSYAVNKNYFLKLKNHFLETKKKLEDINMLNITNQPLDRQWAKLQKKDLWYATNVLLTYQIESFSDIGFQEKGKR